MKCTPSLRAPRPIADPASPAPGLAPLDARRAAAAYTAFAERVDVAGIVADAAAAAAAVDGDDDSAPAAVPVTEGAAAQTPGRVALSWQARVGEDQCGDGGY